MGRLDYRHNEPAVWSMTLGLLHPGEMGASVGAAARCHTEVLWASRGRSDATRRRAEDSGLVDALDLGSILEQCDVVLSVCPPHAALDLATAVADARFDGIYVDANAVAPATTATIARVIEDGGGRFVDGGIIGPPAHRTGTTRLFLAGDEAPRVAAIFDASPLQAICLEAGPPAASALKMAYAAYTKGTTALLLAIRALARQHDVEGALLDEWRTSQPDLVRRSETGALRSAPKAWRFVGEMDEIAASFAAAGLPGGFHHAAAEIYRRLERFKNEPDADLDALLRAILDDDRGHGS
jgi:3-hydroxyisobutyrate dehydrogenase-like beta-hydroxyacid dehydrogenase